MTHLPVSEQYPNPQPVISEDVVPISVRLGSEGAALKMLIRRTDESAKIEKVILKHCGLPVGTDFALIDKNGYVILVANTLNAGDYTVMVLSGDDVP